MSACVIPTTQDGSGDYRCRKRWTPSCSAITSGRRSWYHRRRFAHSPKLKQHDFQNWAPPPAGARGADHLADYYRNIDHYLNRNFLPSVPIERRRNRDSLTPEVGSIDLPATHLQHDVILMDEFSELDALDDIDGEEGDLQGLWGHVRTGLSEETILRHLRTRTHVSSANNLDLNEGLTSDQVHEICVICQVEYENHQKIGTLQCGHEYHAECIMKWLQRKNDCPMCKATALSI